MYILYIVRLEGPLLFQGISFLVQFVHEKDFREAFLLTMKNLEKYPTYDVSCLICHNAD